MKALLIGATLLVSFSTFAQNLYTADAKDSIKIIVIGGIDFTTSCTEKMDDLASRLKKADKVILSREKCTNERGSITILR